MSRMDKFIVSILVGGIALSSIGIAAKGLPNRNINVVAVMFTVDCNYCGALAEADYSIVSEKGQVWCNECHRYEELDKDSSIVKMYFGEDKYAR